jgi:hypothetical protein
MEGLAVMTGIKIGDKLWSDFDGGRHRWVGDVVIGETKASWLVGHKDRPNKINKSTMMENMGRYSPRKWFTESGARDEKFRRRHAYEIGTRVSGQSAGVLRKVAEIIGFVVEEDAS